MPYSRRKQVMGLAVPGNGELDPMTGKKWGSADAVNILRSAIAHKRMEWDRYEHAKPGDVHKHSHVKGVLTELGLFLEALGLHYQVQAAGMSGEGESTTLAVYDGDGRHE